MRNRHLWNTARLVALLLLAAKPQAGRTDSPKHPDPDAGLLAAVDIQSTILEEGITVGDFETWYPGVYPGFQWARETTAVDSNGLFRLDYAVFDPHDRHGQSAQELSILLFRPVSPPGGAIPGISPLASPPGERASRDRHQPARETASGLAVGVIEDALLTAQSFAANARYYAFLGANQSVSLVSHLPDSFPGAETFGGAEGRRVSFHLQPGNHGRAELVMEHAPLLVDLRPGQIEPFRLTLADDVSVFHLQYWDARAADWVEQWTMTNSLPAMVQVTLGLGKLHGRAGAPHELASRIVALPATTIAADIQGAGFTNRPPFIPPTNRPPVQIVAPRVAPAKYGMLARGSAKTAPARQDPSKHGSSHDVELEWLGRSGIELARYVLANDGIGPDGPAVDSKLNKWAGGLGDTNGVLAGLDLNHYEIGAGTVSVKIEDQESKFNINVTDDLILRQALTLIGVGAAQTGALVDSILDWRDRDDLPTLNGAESAFYLALSQPYYAKNGPLDELSELLFVRGVTREMYFGTHSSGLSPVYLPGWADLFTPLSSGLLNINTASLSVLQIIPEIDESLAFAIISGPGGRAGLDGVDGTADDRPFRSVQEIARVPGISPMFLQAWARYLAVRSLVFEVRMTARIDDESRTFVGLLRRNSPRDIQLMNFHWE